jgi:DNA ligase-3
LEYQKFVVTGPYFVACGPKCHCTERVKLFLFLSPIQAEVCKSVEYAMKKCPNGMYSEIKYDGERVQVHKKGSEFKYFSRSLKPVLPHKVSGECKYTV